MQFIATYSNKLKADIARLKFPLYSKQKIYLYKNGTSEIVLNNYLKENYNMTLKAACVLITAKARISTNLGTEIIYTITDKKLSELAKLITYGNLKISGSNILKAAFRI